MELFCIQFGVVGHCQTGENGGVGGGWVGGGGVVGVRGGRCGDYIYQRVRMELLRRTACNWTIVCQQTGVRIVAENTNVSWNRAYYIMAATRIRIDPT